MLLLARERPLGENGTTPHMVVLVELVGNKVDEPQACLRFGLRRRLRPLIRLLVQRHRLKALAGLAGRQPDIVPQHACRTSQEHSSAISTADHATAPRLM